MNLKKSLHQGFSILFRLMSGFIVSLLYIDNEEVKWDTILKIRSRCKPISKRGGKIDHRKRNRKTKKCIYLKNKERKNCFIIKIFS